MKNINYLELMPYEIQDKIWKHVHELRLNDTHTQLLNEINNDIPPARVLVYDNPTLYMNKLHEVMNIISQSDNYCDILPRCYKILIWFLVKFYTIPSEPPQEIIGLLNFRGQELYHHINKMNHNIHIMSYTKYDKYKTLIEIENTLSVFTYHELVAYKIMLSMINMKSI